MKPHKILFLITTLTLLLTLIPHPAQACSCAVPGAFVEEMAGATAVFAGTITSIKVPAPSNGVISTADSVRVTVQVQTVWKGPVKPALVVLTARDDISCGFEFERGETYLIYAYGSETALRTNLCTLTQPLAQVNQNDLASLREGTTPQSPPSFRTTFAALLFLGVLSFILLAATLINKKPQHLHS